METIGLSPKTVAAAITTYLATLVVGLVGDAAPWLDYDPTVVEAFLYPIVIAGVTAVAAFLAKPGTVVHKGSGNVGDPTVPPGIQGDV